MKEGKLKQNKMNVTNVTKLKENRFYFTIYNLTEKQAKEANSIYASFIN